MSCSLCPQSNPGMKFGYQDVLVSMQKWEDPILAIKQVRTEKLILLVTEFQPQLHHQYI